MDRLFQPAPVISVTSYGETSSRPSGTSSPVFTIKGYKDSASQTEDQTVSLENLSEDLEALLDDKILPDVQLMVGSTSIPCHRAVLAARTKVFSAMFQHDMIESTSGVLEIKDIDVDTIELFLKYLYSGKIPGSLTEDMLVNLFKTACKYEVHALMRVCSRELMKNINDDNCLFYLTLAEAYSYQYFKDEVACYIAKDDSLIDSEDWINFSSENCKLGTEVYRKHFEMKKSKRRKLN